MKNHKIFDFLNDRYYKLMVDMSKEIHAEGEFENIRNEFNILDLQHFYDVCKEHELDGVVGNAAISLGLELPSYWKEAYKKHQFRQEFLREKAKYICSIMDSYGIPMVVLKNGGIMLSMINEAVKCPMEDIDSLIKKKDFYKAHELLVNNGFVFKFRSEFEEDKLDEAYRHGSAEYYLLMPDGDKMWFELSWRAVDGRWIRPDLEPSTDEFIDNSFVPTATKVHVLSPEDNLLQVCIHTAKHSYCRAPGLRLHMDVDRIVSHNDINWDLFIQKVKKSHVCKSTYISLFIPSVIFGTSVPEKVLNELRPKDINKLLNILAKASLIHPFERKFTKFQFLRFQTSLYDNFSDVFKVIYPSKEWINERYNCKSAGDRFIAIIFRFFDLIGIRKKK